MRWHRNSLFLKGGVGEELAFVFGDLMGVWILWRGDGEGTL